MKKQKSEVRSRKSAGVEDAGRLSACTARARSVLLAAANSRSIRFRFSEPARSKVRGRRSAKAARQSRLKSENIQDIAAKQAALVTEFDVNGLKVLVKRPRRKPDGFRRSVPSRRRAQYHRRQRRHRGADAFGLDRGECEFSARAHAI